jgi:SAM-dependent methyltransferase
MSTVKHTAMSRVADATASGGETGEADRAAGVQLLRLMWGIHISRCVYAVAELGIADLLADGSSSTEELAVATRSDESSLYRVLRLLAALGVFEEHEHRSFGLTAVGERLRSDAAVAMRSWATMLDGVGVLRSFEHILHSVRTGAPAFDTAFGSGLFEFLAERPESAAVFDAAMAERTAAFAPSVAGGYDFSDIRTVVDVGGGTGTLLVEILRRHAHLQGVLVETPPVAARADTVLDAAELTDRCQVLAGDFFEQIPAGADRYLLANVLHDWDDARSIRILRNCRRAMARIGRVLIVERLIPEDGSDPVPTLLSDINMLVLSGGKERTNAEYGELLETAGLKMLSVRAVAFPYGIVEATVG